VQELRDAIQSKVGERLKIATAADFHLNPENLESLRRMLGRIASTSAISCLSSLMNIPSSSMGPDVACDSAVWRAADHHPPRTKRHFAIPSERLRKWVRQGCFVQVTPGLSHWRLGTGSQQEALQMDRQGLCSFCGE